METGQDIIKHFEEVINNQDPALMQKIQVMAAKSQMQIYDLHNRALGCHCECMGMEVDNSFAMASGKKPPYGKPEFNMVLNKWGLVDSANELTV